MTRRALLISFLCLLAAAALAQAPSKSPAAKPKVIVDDGPPDAYLFTPEEHAKLRDLQYQGDQLEIQNKKLELEIEQNKARQRELLDQMLAVASRVAEARHINLDLYQLDAVEMKFVKKKK